MKPQLIALKKNSLMSLFFSSFLTLSLCFLLIGLYICFVKDDFDDNNDFF